MDSIAVINACTVLTDADIWPMVEAVEFQIDKHFYPQWGISATLKFIPRGVKPPIGYWWLAVLDDADQAGALGYHDITPQGQPLGKVFVKTTWAYGEKVSVILSHEVLEMLADPDVNLLVQEGPSMHETDSFTANTANYRYGFLSAGLHQVLAKPAGAELDSDEQRQVEMGREFVAEVLAGASLVSKGQTKAASPSHATNVLAYALGPLQSMERVKDLSEERVIQFLEQVHNALDETVQAHRVTGQPERLKDAAEFFGHLSDEILATLS